MVLQDGSKVVFPKNASFREDLSFDKELSNSKDFSRFLGMLIEGCEEKIVLLLNKLKKMAVVSASHSKRELKILDCMVRYGKFVLANRRSDMNK
ncbi:hypothetical protein AAG906_024901 [Vitis piasezkii]